MKKLWAFLTKDISFLPYYKTSTFGFFLGKKFCGNHLVLLILTPTFWIACQLQAKAVDCPIAPDRVFLKKEGDLVFWKKQDGKPLTLGFDRNSRLLNGNRLEDGQSLKIFGASKLQNGYSLRVLSPNAKTPTETDPIDSQNDCKYKIELTQDIRDTFQPAKPGDIEFFKVGDQDATKKKLKALFNNEKYFWISKKDLQDFPRPQQDILQDILLFLKILIGIVGIMCARVVFFDSVPSLLKFKNKSPDDKNKNMDDKNESSDDKSKESSEERRIDLIQVLQDQNDLIKETASKNEQSYKEILRELQKIVSFLTVEFSKLLSGIDLNNEKSSEQFRGFVENLWQKMEDRIKPLTPEETKKTTEEETKSIENAKPTSDFDVSDTPAEWSQLVIEFNKKNINYFENAQYSFLSLTEKSKADKPGRDARRIMQFEISPDNSNAYFLRIELTKNDWLIPNILSPRFDEVLYKLPEYLTNYPEIFGFYGSPVLVRPAQLIKLGTV
jgi:hypothetical protein